MRIDIITVVPELLVSPLNESILKRAQQKGLVEIAVHNLRDYTFDRYRQVDDYPFGGEAGMVMKPEPIFRCIEQLQSERTYDEVIYTSPTAPIQPARSEPTLDARKHRYPVRTLQRDRLPGARTSHHTRNLDRRLRLDWRRAGRGDYRRQRGTRDSGRDRRRSFGTDGQFPDNLLAPPVYTRPADFRGWKVPDVLLSGNPKEIAKWQEEQAFERTERLRPDLLDPQSV